MRAIEINESKSSPVDRKKLKEVATAINVLDIDYGITYFNEKQNHIFVIVGDGSPFDEDRLTESILEHVATKWDRQKEITVQIENESGPPGEGWKKV